LYLGAWDTGFKAEKRLLGKKNVFVFLRLRNCQLMGASGSREKGWMAEQSTWLILGLEFRRAAKNVIYG